MPSPIPLLTAALTSLLALTLAPAPVAGADASARPVTAEGEDTGRLVLVLDSSGSMKEPAAGGGTKIDAARSALRDVVQQLPDTAQVGIRVFGAKVFDRTEPGACTDTQNVVPVGPLDRDALNRAVTKYKPYGETPIGNALERAAQDLGPARDGAQRTIVLLSDGEPTCAPDPCQVARQLRNQGIELRINVVGLDVTGKARKALQCVAKSGGGDYYDASSADELASSMVKVSVRELRGFRLNGERIEGGLSSAEPTEVEPGTYVDTSLPDEGKRYYLIDRPENGGVAVSALARPARSDENWNTRILVDLLTPDGDLCAHKFVQSAQVLGRSPIASIGAEHNQLATSPTAKDEECRSADQLVATVAMTPADHDFRLQVSTFPEVENVDELPSAVDPTDDAWVRNVQIPSGGGTPVVGGVSFDDAPELEPREVYTDSVRPGEQLVYKVPAEYGQAVRLSARLGTDQQAAGLLGIGPQVMLEAFNALGQKQRIASGNGVAGAVGYNGQQPRLLTAVVPPIRLRNIESTDDQLSTTTHDGDQYFVLGMGETSGEQTANFAAPVQLRAELDGEVSGTPEYAGEVQGAAAEDTEPEESDQESATAPSEDQPAEGSGTGVLPWAIGGVVLVVVAGAAFALGRRGRTRA